MLPGKARTLLDPALALTSKGLGTVAALGGFEIDTLDVPRQDALDTAKGRKEMAARMRGRGHAGAGDADRYFGKPKGKLGRGEEGVW